MRLKRLAITVLDQQGILLTAWSIRQQWNFETLLENYPPLKLLSFLSMVVSQLSMQ